MLGQGIGNTLPKLNRLLLPLQMCALYYYVTNIQFKSVYFTVYIYCSHLMHHLFVFIACC